MPPLAPATDAIELHDLTLGYDGHPAVHHLDGAFAQGSLTAVVGPNGSGKSTLLKGIMGTLRPLGGHLHATPRSPICRRGGDRPWLPGPP